MNIIIIYETIIKREKYVCDGLIITDKTITLLYPNREVTIMRVDGDSVRYEIQNSTITDEEVKGKRA